MTTLLLIVACLGQATDASLSAQLDVDFRELLAKDPDPTAVKYAAKLLAGKNIEDGLQQCRRSRSKAVIPLLLMQMLQSDGQSEYDLGRYVDTLAILTGEDLVNPWQSRGDRKESVRSAVEQWSKSWWGPRKAQTTTHLDEMSTDQLRVVVDRLLGNIRRMRRNYAELNDFDLHGIGATYALSTLMATYNSNSGDRPAFWPVELNAKMVPVVLERAEYRPDRAPAVPLKSLNFAVVELLGALRQNCGAPELDKIPDDKGQNATCRLAVILSLHRSGERVPTAPLLSILASEKTLESRLVAIFALRYSRDRETVGPKLVELLDDRNDEIRTAAVISLAGPLPVAALPKLKKVVDNLDPPEAMTFVFDVLGKYNQPEAQQILIDFMKAGLEEGQKAKYLYNAIRALEQSSGKRWMEAGAFDEPYYRKKCQEAIQWWNNREMPSSSKTPGSK